MLSHQVARMPVPPCRRDAGPRPELRLCLRTCGQRLGGLLCIVAGWSRAFNHRLTRPSDALRRRGTRAAGAAAKPFPRRSVGTRSPGIRATDSTFRQNIARSSLRRPSTAHGVDVEPATKQRRIDVAEIDNEFQVAVVEAARGQVPGRSGRHGSGVPASKTGPAVPWSVPPWAFSFTRRPNSENISTTTRSPKPCSRRSARNLATERETVRSSSRCV